NQDGDKGVEDAKGDTKEIDVVGIVGEEGGVQPPEDPEPTYYPNPSQHMATTPTVKNITIQDKHGSDAIWDIALYLKKPNRLYSENDAKEKPGIEHK
ncbi:hypothetical protein FRC11_004260, partial [Ceratobasidium sp. 423]